MSAFPNLRHVRLFCACLREKSISRAAETCGVTQPAASQAIMRLEHVFGSILVDRQRNAIVATPEGSIVYARLQRTLDFIRAGLYGTFGSGPGPEVEHRVTMPHLRALGAFGQGKSFSAAARLLGQTEPAVYRMARNAEAALNISLFEGAGRSVTLTRIGQAAVRWSSLALRELEIAVTELREAEGRFDGNLRIGTLPLMRTNVMPRAVIKIAERHPEASFEISEGNYDEMLADLEAGRIDMILGALHDNLPTNRLAQENLFEFQLSVVCGAHHPLSKITEIGLDDLASYPWVVSSRGTPSRALFDELRALFPQQRGTRQTVEVDSLVASRGVLMYSDHLTLLSDHQIQFEVDAGYLTRIDFELPAHAPMIGITYRKSWKPTALQSKFVEALKWASTQALSDLYQRPIATGQVTGGKQVQLQ